MPVPVLLVLAVFVCPIGYLSLLIIMQESSVPRPPVVPFFFIFGTLGGWLLSFSFPPGLLLVLGSLSLLTAAPVALLASSVFLSVQPERTLFHRVAMWSGYGYAILVGFLIIGFAVTQWSYASLVQLRSWA